MSKSYEKLSEERLLASELLQNKIIARILRPTETEVAIQCTDKSHFFVHETENSVELSIT